MRNNTILQRAFYMGKIMFWKGFRLGIPVGFILGLITGYFIGGMK